MRTPFAACTICSIGGRVESITYASANNVFDKYIIAIFCEPAVNTERSAPRPAPLKAAALRRLRRP